jgi:predicted enzyme related to lactoylglutathione lyase
MPRVIHFEIPAENPDQLAEFYARTFDWEIQKWEGPVDYWLITTGEQDEPGIDGAITRKENLKAVTNTIDVPSTDEYINKVVENGGKVDLP